MPTSLKHLQIGSGEAAEAEPPAAKVPDLMLCQDCLATAPFTMRGHLGETRCGCGGEYCGCEGCAEQAAKLRQNGEQREAQQSLFEDSEHEWVCHPTRGWHLALKTKGTNHV